MNEVRACLKIFSLVTMGTLDVFIRKRQLIDIYSYVMSKCDFDSSNVEV